MRKSTAYYFGKISAEIKFRSLDICLYCAKDFQPPSGSYNTGEPGSYEGWMIAYCSWDCAMLGDPENMKANSWDGEPLS